MKTLNLNGTAAAAAAAADGGSSQHLYGREDELQHLQHIWGQVVADSRARRVFLRGYAGIGKTQLVTTFLDLLRKDNPTVSLVMGKFDPHNIVPFSALADGLSQWIQNRMDTRSGAELMALRQKVMDQVVGSSPSSSLALLQAIPALAAFLETTEAGADEAKAMALPVPTPSTAKARPQLEYQLQTLLQNVIASKDHPLILWLDDIQWADQASLNVLLNLLQNSFATDMLILGSYRDLVDQNQDGQDGVPLQRMLNQVQSQAAGGTGTTTPLLVSLQLGNLDLTTTQTYIADVLLLEPSEVDDLAQAIYAKTHGNIYYTRASLLLLEQCHILQYSYNTYRWEWDLGRIQTEMGVSRNVVDVTLASLQLLPDDVQHALSVAALGFLRSSFDLETLQLLLQAVDHNNSPPTYLDPQTPASNLQDRLEVAVTHGLLENPVGTQDYRFLHDRIREAAHCLWDKQPQGEKNQAIIRIGKCLLDLSSSSSSPTTSASSSVFVEKLGGAAIIAETNNKGNNNNNDWMIFAGLDNLNSIQSTEELLSQTGMSLRDLIQWNFHAGSIAVQRSAFASASTYLQKALALVSAVENRWLEDEKSTKKDIAEGDKNQRQSLYHTCLELYVMAANIGFCLGDSDRAQSTLQEVIDNAHSERDKLPGYLALAEGLGQKERHEEALEVDHKAMAILNPGFPTWFLPVHLLSDIQYLKKSFQRKTDEEILSLPILDNNDDRVLAMKILSSMWIRAYLSQKMVTSLLCMTRALRMTLDHGLSPPGGLAFAAYGALLCGPLAEYKTGVRLGFLSHKILKVTNGKEFESRILFTAAAHTDAWVQPLTTVQETLLQGYKSGMETGDTEFAAFNLQYYNIHAFLMGSPLEPIIDECEKLIQLTNQHEVESVRAIVLPFHQMLLDLTGKTEDPMAWVNTLETSDRARRKSAKIKNPSENVKIIWSYMSRGQLAYFFDEPELADQIWIKLKPLLAGMASYSAPTIDIFMTGLIAAAMFRKTGRRKYRIQAQKAVKEMKCLMEKYNTGLNLLHRYYILQAEYECTCEGKSKSSGKIREVFDRAISVVSKAGFVQDNALAHELCGQHFVDRDDIFWAKHYLTTARNLYLDWGAVAKAEHLARTRSAFMDDTTGRKSSMNRMSISKRFPLSSSKQLSLEMSLDGMHQQQDSTTASQDETSDGKTISS